MTLITYIRYESDFQQIKKIFKCIQKYMEILTIQQLWQRIERAEAMAREKGNADTKEQQVTNNEKKGEQQ